MSNLNQQSPPVRVQAVQATPLKHTSPVPIGVSRSINVPIGQDPLALLSAGQGGLITPPRHAAPDQISAPISAPAPAPNSSLSVTPSDGSHVRSQSPSVSSMSGTGGSASAAAPLAYSIRSGNPEAMAREFLSNGNAPPPLDLQAALSGDVAADVPVLLRHCAWQSILDRTAPSAGPGGRCYAFPLWQAPPQPGGPCMVRELSVAMAARLQALLRLRMFGELSAEAAGVLASEAALSAEAEGGSGGGGKAAAISTLQLQLLLLHLETPSPTAKGEETIEELLALHGALTACMAAWRRTAKSTGEAEAQAEAEAHSRHLQLWAWRVKSAVVNAALRLRQPKLALAELEDMLAEIARIGGERRSVREGEGGGGSVAAAAGQDRDRDIRRAEIIIRCRIARLLLHQGAIKLGIEHCDAAMQLAAAPSSSSGSSSSCGGDAPPQDEGGDRLAATQVNFARGLAHFGLSEFEAALRIFAEILDSLAAQPQSSAPLSELACPASEAGAVAALALEHEDSQTLLSAAVNNFALCAFHLKAVGTAIARLEGHILGDPARRLCDPVVFNLCTLYDLTSGPAVSVCKKQVLRAVAAMYHVSGVITPKSYKL